jgi:hypothetical protein
MYLINICVLPEKQLSGENTAPCPLFQIALKILNACAAHYRQVPWNESARRLREPGRAITDRDQNPPQ